jgi:hypothetical protein
MADAHHVYNSHPHTYPAVNRATTQPRDASLDFLSTSTSLQSPPALSKASIIGIAVIGTIVALGFAVASVLLCKYSRNRKRRAEGRRVLDDRNSYPAWNPNAPPVPEFAQRRTNSGVELQPLSKAAVRPAGHDSPEIRGLAHPGEPVVVDVATEPQYGKSRPHDIV